MKLSEKYIWGIKSEFVKESLEYKGDGVNPNKLDAIDFGNLFIDVIDRAEKRVDAVVDVFLLDMKKIKKTTEFFQENLFYDFITSSRLAIDKQFSERGKTRDVLTKWIYKNSQRLKINMELIGREKLSMELVRYFCGKNFQGYKSKEFAEMILSYFPESVIPDAN